MQRKLELTQLSYDKTERVLSADFTDVFSPSDPLPTEIMVHSPKTGKWAAFRPMREVKDPEQDVMYWEYYAPAERCYLHLFND